MSFKNNLKNNFKKNITEKIKPLLIPVGIGFATLLVAFEIWYYGFGAPYPGKSHEISWVQLAEMNYRTGEIGPALKPYDGARVKIAGYAVPLGDSFRYVDEFLVVPNGQACIHVPPPPPNQMIHGKLKEEISTKKIRGPIWVFGSLHFEKVRSVYGYSTFRLDIEKIEPYVFLGYERLQEMLRERQEMPHKGRER